MPSVPPGRGLNDSGVRCTRCTYLGSNLISLWTRCRFRLPPPAGHRCVRDAQLGLPGLALYSLTERTLSISAWTSTPGS